MTIDMTPIRKTLAAAVCFFVVVLTVAFLALGGKKQPVVASGSSEKATTLPTATASQTEASYSFVVPDQLPTVPENSTANRNETTAAVPETTAPGAETTTAVSEKTTAAGTEKTTAAGTEKTTAAGAETTTAAKPATTAAAKGSNYEYAYAGFNPSVATVNEEKWYLLLVNQDYILPDNFKVKTAAIADGSQTLDYRVVPYYNKMVAAAKADGISLIAVSGYRTLERQRNNFTRKINYYQGLGYSKAEATRLASKIVLMPGTSEHNAGLAMDFGTNGNTTLDENFGKTAAYKWLSEHAADYGFILRYASNTTNITKVTYEPWHWRYVGEKAAKEIKARGVTLEEYLGYYP